MPASTPASGEDCTQEVCCRLLGKARAGQLDLNLVLADDTAERRELVRAIDMVRKRVQRSGNGDQPLNDRLTPGPDLDQRERTLPGTRGDPPKRPRQAVPERPLGSDRRTLDPWLDGARDRRKDGLAP